MLVPPAELVARAKATITECSVRDVHDGISQDTLLIDVREPAEFAKAHLPGALHIPRGMLEFDIHKLVEQASDKGAETPIVLYCGTGGRSALAAESLETLGYRSVQSMDGGIVAWNKAGFPVEN